MISLFTRRRSRRPERFHDDAPWPVENEWAAAKVNELLPGGSGEMIWTDETCGEKCVVLHNMGGDRNVFRNPNCADHGEDPDA